MKPTKTRGRVAQRVLGSVLLVAAALCVVFGLRQEAPAAATPGDDRRARTPVISARRVPFVFTDAVARTRLENTLREYLAQYDACVTVDDARGDGARLASVGAETPLAPASTLKILTGVAALAALGPDETFVTRALVDDAGTLYLRGGGDPVLTTPAYEASIRANPRSRTDPVTSLVSLADQVVTSGVRSVPTIATDDSRHDDTRFLPGWKPGYTADVGALGALTVNDGTSGGTRVADPALNAGETLKALLVERGVQVGAVTHGTAPETAREVGSVSSPPMSDIVAAMITSSDNLTAELLTREVGLARGGDGSTAAGTRASLALLDELGIPTTGLDLRDGSGLDAANRVTCDAVIASLELTGDPRFAAVDRGLPVAGSSGTLAGRFLGDPLLQGVLRAKTGNLAGVASLAGLVDDAEHLRFALVVNDGFTEAQGRAITDRVARLVATYPEATPPELVPPP